MRRLIAVCCFLVLCSCRREVIHPEPTEEGSFVLASSLKMGDRDSTTQLLRGFYPIEHGAWRWTAGRFSVALRPPKNGGERGAKLRFGFTAPDPVLKKLGSVTLTASVGGHPVGTKTANSATPEVLEGLVPAEQLRGETVTIDFELARYLPAGILDPRELGVIAQNVALDPL